MNSIFGYNKRSQISSRLAVIGFLFAFGFMSIIGYLMFDQYDTYFETTGYYSSEVENVADKFRSGLQLFDWIIIGLMVVLIIGVAITSYSLASAPVFFIVMFLSAAFEGFISYFFNFMFAQLVSSSAFTATLVHFPRTVLICTNLHWVALTSIVVGAITMYGKKQQGQFLG